LFRCASTELLFSYCGSVAAPGAAARAPRSSSCDAQRAAPRATILVLWSSTYDAHAGNGLGITIKYLRRTASSAAGSGLSNTIKYLRGAAGNGLGTTIKYLRRTTRQRPRHHDQVPATHNERHHGQRPRHHDQGPATHNERRRGQRPESVPGTTDLPFTTSAGVAAVEGGVKNTGFTANFPSKIPQIQVFTSRVGAIVRPKKKPVLIQGMFCPSKISGTGTNFGLLVHTLPGSNKLRVLKPSMVLS
jgi:hypothetical protein